jgi:hypothetical protein
MKPLLLPLALCLSVVSTASATLELTGELIPFKETKEAGEKAAAPEAMRAAYGPRPITQSKVLNVTVRNASGKQEPGVTVRYWIIGRDPNSSKSALLDGGEAQVSLKPNGVEVIASEPVKTTYTPPAIFKQRNAPKPAAPPPKPAEGEEVKNVAPKGFRISGFAIQAVRDDRVIAENVQDEGVKKLIGSEGKKPGPLFSVERPQKADE